MEKKSAEDYLDKLLDSVNDENAKKENFEDSVAELKTAKYGKLVEEDSMYSRHVSKSEADFLKEFESELIGDSEDLSFSLSNFAMAEEPILMDEIPEGMLDELFSGTDGLNLTEIPQELPTEEEGLDLGNLGDEDLMNLLAGVDGLEDIGSLLNKGEITEITEDELEAFSIYAENEMSAQESSTESVAKAGEKPKGKGNFLDKIKGFFEFLLKSEEDDLEFKPAGPPTVEVLTGENADILAQLDALEEMPSKKDSKAKDKKKKEKKEKKKKEKKPKEPKKVKPPKPKKEKKPKEVDNTPPLPKGPVIMIWLMAGSMLALVLLAVNMISYNGPISNAKILKNQGNYAEAFAEINGIEIKEKDMEMYSQLSILATVDSEINA